MAPYLFNYFIMVFNCSHKNLMVSLDTKIPMYLKSSGQDSSGQNFSENFSRNLMVWVSEYGINIWSEIR